MELAEYQHINRAENYIVTQHSRRRIGERGILLRDVMRVIDGGEIIEEYPDDFPFPSCLVLGPSTDGRQLHAVVSMSKGDIYLITAYEPDPDLWEDDLRTRKERSK